MSKKDHAIAFVIFCCKSSFTWAEHNQKWYHVGLHYFKTHEEMYNDFLIKQEQLKSTAEKYNFKDIEKSLTNGKGKI